MSARLYSDAAQALQADLVSKRSSPVCTDKTRSSGTQRRPAEPEKDQRHRAAHYPMSLASVATSVRHHALSNASVTTSTMTSLLPDLAAQLSVYQQNGSAKTRESVMCAAQVGIVQKRAIERAAPHHSPGEPRVHKIGVGEVDLVAGERAQCCRAKAASRRLTCPTRIRPSAASHQSGGGSSRMPLSRSPCSVRSAPSNEARAESIGQTRPTRGGPDGVSAPCR